MSERKNTHLLKFLDLTTWSLRLAQYKMFVVLLAPVFLLFIFIAVKMSLKSSQEEAVFFKAQQAYVSLKDDEKLSISALDSLKEVLRKHPELKPAYEAATIQKLMVAGDKTQIESWMNAFLKRLLRRPVSYYTQFAVTTVKIEKGELETALHEAITLKESMLTDTVFWGQARECSYGSTLFAFNLLRIAMLTQSLGKEQEELVAWKEFKRYAGWEGDHPLIHLDPRGFSELLESFSCQNVSLKGYIQYREQNLIKN